MTCRTGRRECQPLAAERLAALAGPDWTYPSITLPALEAVHAAKEQNPYGHPAYRFSAWPADQRV